MGKDEENLKGYSPIDILYFHSRMSIIYFSSYFNKYEVPWALEEGKWKNDVSKMEEIQHQKISTLNFTSFSNIEMS